MKKRTLTLLAPTVFALLVVSTHGSDKKASRLDGRWQAWYTSSQSKSYVMEFTGDRFHAVEGEQWYKGEILIDAEADPPQIDFTILECECGFLDKTSKAIFRWDGEDIEIRAPEPGKERPTKFDFESGETMRLVREGDSDGPPSP